VNQFVFVPLVVLDAMEAFVTFICPQGDVLTALLELSSSTREEINRINAELVGKDFEHAEED